MSTIVLPAGYRAMVLAMCAKFPELHVNVDEKQRVLTERINQQACHLWGRRWGGKVRTGLDPVANRSKDSQGYREDDGRVSTWDLFRGNATADVLVQDGQAPDHPDQPLSDGTFIPVEPKDWLEGASVPPEEEPGEEPPPDDRLLQILEGLIADMDALEARDDQQARQLLEQAATITDLQNRLAALEGRKLKVVGRSQGSGWGPLAHSHQVDLPVVEG